MKQKIFLTKILHIIEKTLTNLKEEELDLLLKGKGFLTFHFDNESSYLNNPDTASETEIIDELKNCDDRDMGHVILKKIKNKETLRSMARTLQINISSNDARQQIERKIIEFIVGSKLRTKAINSVELQEKTKIKK